MCIPYRLIVIINGTSIVCSFSAVIRRRWEIVSPSWLSFIKRCKNAFYWFRSLFDSYLLRVGGIQCLPSAPSCTIPSRLIGLRVGTLPRVSCVLLCLFVCHHCRWVRGCMAFGNGVLPALRFVSWDCRMNVNMCYRFCVPITTV